MDESATHTQPGHDVGSGGTARRSKALVKQPDGSWYDPETGEVVEVEDGVGNEAAPSVPTKPKRKPARRAPPGEDKRAKFVRLVNPRVERALGAIRSIGKLGGINSRNYDFGSADIERITEALKTEVRLMADRLGRKKPRQLPLFDIDSAPEQ